MEDFLRETTSAELTGWFAYLQVDDEVQAQRTAIALLKAFNGGQKRPAQQTDDDEEVIDTTKPEFAQQFKGFTNTPKQPQRSMPTRPMSTQILMG